MSHSSTLMKKVRYGYAFAHGKNQNQKRDASTCASGGFYTSPTAAQTVNAGDPLTISWNPDCLNNTVAADIYLYEPAAPNPRIHLWQNVNYRLGSFDTTLNGQWWNSSASATLQLTIVPHGTAPFLATLPAGPLFTATYTAPTSGAPATYDAASGAIQNVNNFSSSNHLSKGKIAAAVIMPLLVVCAIFAGIYIWKQRKAGRTERQKWNEAVDKRMSTISGDWKSITPAGATAAIRNSIAPGDRASSFSFGVNRPISNVAMEGGHAGIGARGMQAGGGIDMITPQMSQLQSGLRNPSSLTAERVSRISFAPDTRPSGESRRSLHNQRSSRFQTSIVPPLPERQDSGDIMSPTQTSGPLTLTADDIKARMNGQESAPRPSMDEVMPALSMMRTGEYATGNDELLFNPPSPPAATHQSAPKSVVGMMPMQPMPANMMSPDEMLRAYAEQRRNNVASPPPNGPSVPAPVANYNGNGMRILYSPTSTDSATLAMSPQTARKSLAPTIASRYDDEDAYGGTA
ncbi:hypothetical protein EUX98_g6281 [Antrodiella citrinella]|uniref:Uncharacterized protein n=1 Tax=Antrodiella citrinella TaxID=2447956 RepID=A0A4S4MRJ8_9APHY|nr:hypothetical protein EUX98_g6281 [Antrodiella citrinella]